MKNFKKINKSVYISFMLLLAVVLIVGCGGGSAGNTGAGSSGGANASSNSNGSNQASSDGESYHFIYVGKLVHPWYEKIATGVEDAVQEYKAQGINIKAEWDYPPQADVVMQTEKIEAALAKNPDAIAIAVLDEASQTSVINNAVEQGKKVITFDSDAPSSKRIAFVGNNRTKEDGAALAELMAEKMNYEGEIALLIGSISAPTHILRVEGFKEVMAKYPNIKIVTEQADNDELQKSVQLTESILQAHPNIKGIFGNNATNVIGAGQVVKDAGKAGQILVTGIGDMPETVALIEDGAVTAVMAEDLYGQGYQSVKFLLDLAQGKEVPEMYQADSFMITQDSLEEYYQRAGASKAK